MSRNRILHNVQDVFVGSTSDETDSLVTGIAGHQILKRITRVQSFNYSIDLPQQDALTFGKSKAFSRDSNEPPSVNLSLSYLLNGVDNEKRIGLNTELAKCISHDMLTASTKDARNIYLTINEQDQDAQQQKDWSSSYSHSESTVGDASATGYGVVAFQNCYLNSYSLSIAPQTLPSVNLGYVADNMNAYSSGSGINIPYLDSKKGEVTDTVASVYASDFTTDIDGWEDSDAALTWVANYGGETNVLKVTPDGAGERVHYAYKDIGLVIGKKYKITGKYHIQTGGNLKGIDIMDTYSCDNCTGGTWLEFSTEFIATDSKIYFYGTDSSGDRTFTASGSGSDFAIKNIVVTEIKEFIIPNQYIDDSDYTSNFTKDYAKTIVTISNVGVSGVTGFLNDEITSCDIDFSIDRSDISHVGHKLISNREPKIPMMANLNFNTLVKESVTGSFLDNMKENENYNVTIDLKSKSNQTLSKYIFSGAKFEGVNYDASLNANKTASLKFTNYMDLESQSEGLFVTGLITSATSGTDVIYPQF